MRNQIISSIFLNFDPVDSTHLKSFKEASQIFKNPVLGGIILAFFIAVRVWSGGYDAQQYYLRWPPPDATTPYWVYLFTYPLSWLGWPLSWQVLVLCTAVIACFVYALRSNQHWWVILLCSPMVFNNWWGQIEVLSILGILIGLLLLEEKIPDGWIAAVWLLLGAKIQINYGLILLFTFWFYRKRGLKAFRPGLLVFAIEVGLTMVIWPFWPVRLISVYKVTQFGAANASRWPYGMIAWIPALLPIRMGASQRLRLTAAGSLLGTPYFTLHHCLGLLLLSDYAWQLPLSWLPIIMIYHTRDWSMYAWIIPLTILIYDCFLLWQTNRKKSLPISDIKQQSDLDKPNANHSVLAD